MKNLKKGFTLVEMLIVVVIIGILAAALLPRLQGAQAATRDVAREKSLGDVSAAIEMYAAQRGEYPAADMTNYSATNALKKLLVDERKYLKDMPVDPKKSTRIKVGGVAAMTGNDYGYIVLKKNAQLSGAYALISLAETTDKANATAAMVEALTSSNDASDMKLCDEVVIDGNSSSAPAADWTTGGTCKVATEADLRYVMIR